VVEVIKIYLLTCNVSTMNSEIKIIDFSAQLSGYFHDLNKAWLEKYFEVEPIDQQMLDNPKKYFIDKGGFIFFATLQNEVVGTVALIKNNDQVYELSKMAVSEHHQGKKIGHQLLAFCINKTKELGAKKLILFSNTLLAPAIHLYKKYGFITVKMESSDYKRCNIKMELIV
jgi:N-acetylglutamate synthase-like GNAT family acetyltransferase